MIWEFINTSLGTYTCGMVWGTILSVNCRTRVGRSPVRLSQGKGVEVLQIIRYDILITIMAMKKMREEELSEEMLQKKTQ